MKDLTDTTPSQTVLGQNVRLPGVPAPDQGEDLATSAEAPLPKPKTELGKGKPDQRKEDDTGYVMVKKISTTGLSLRYDGPYKILGKGFRTYLIDRDGVRQVVDISKTKPAPQPKKPKPNKTRRQERDVKGDKNNEDNRGQEERERRTKKLPNYLKDFVPK